MIVIAIVAVLAAIAIPKFLAAGTDRDEECIRQMFAAEAGAKCPVSDTAYVRSAESPVACPDPEHHLGENARVVKEGDRRIFRRSYPDFPLPAGEEVELSDGSIWFATMLKVEKGAVRVEERRAFLSQYVVGPAFVLVGFLLAGFGVFALVRMFRGKEEGCVPFVCLAFGLLFSCIGYFMMKNRVVEIPRGKATVIFKSDIWGIELGGSETIQGVRAVYRDPQDRVRVLYEKEGEMVHADLFRLPLEEVGALKPVQEALFPPPSKPEPK